MTKSKLESGYIVELRGGSRYMVIKNVLVCGCVTDLLLGETGYMTLPSYNENLKCNGDKEFDIIKVYKPKHYGYGLKSLFAKEDVFHALELVDDGVVEMTVDEIAKKLGVQNLKIIGER